LCAIGLSASAAIDKRSVIWTGPNDFSRNLIVSNEPCEENIVLDQPALINPIQIKPLEPFIPAVQNIVRDINPIIQTPIIETPTFIAPPPPPPVVVEEPCEEPAILLPSREPKIVIPPPVTSFSYSTFEEPTIEFKPTIIETPKFLPSPVNVAPLEPILPPVVVEEPCEEPAILLPSGEPKIVIPPPVTSFSYSTFEEPTIEFKPTIIETPKLLPRPVNIAPAEPIGPSIISTSETFVQDVVKDLKPIILGPLRPNFSSISAPIELNASRPVEEIKTPVNNIVQEINTVVYETPKLEEPCVETLDETLKKIEPIIPPVQHIVRDFKPIQFETPKLIAPLEIIRPPVQNIVRDFKPVVVETPKLFNPTEIIRPPVQNIVRDIKPIIVETPKFVPSPIVVEEPTLVVDQTVKTVQPFVSSQIVNVDTFGPQAVQTAFTKLEPIRPCSKLC
jgi:hypothetical protein